MKQSFPNADTKGTNRIKKYFFVYHYMSFLSPILSGELDRWLVISSSASLTCKHDEINMAQLDDSLLFSVDKSAMTQVLNGFLGHGLKGEFDESVSSVCRKPY